jgi:hypothetical protein
MPEVPEYFEQEDEKISEQSCYKRNQIPLYALTQ